MNILHHPSTHPSFHVFRRTIVCSGAAVRPRSWPPALPAPPVAVCCLSFLGRLPPSPGMRLFPPRVGVCVGMNLACMYQVPFQGSGRGSHSAEGCGMVMAP